MLLQAPLLLGCDIRNMTKETMEVVANKEVIAVNQGNYKYLSTKTIMFHPSSNSCINSYQFFDFMLWPAIDPYGFQAKKVRMEGDEEVKFMEPLFGSLYANMPYSAQICHSYLFSLPSNRFGQLLFLAIE